MQTEVTVKSGGMRAYFERDWRLVIEGQFMVAAALYCCLVPSGCIDNYGIKLSPDKKLP